jgi:hypothetical protein|tara:strand:+ start:209 stop:478 length:270 start_codon:yes stop_codon:yes gene_type:complete
METITNFTNKELTSKIQNLLKEDFTKCKILNSLTSKTISLDCKWNGCKYITNVYLEKITNIKYKYQISVGTTYFPYSKKGIQQAINYIN